jgi:hypothetical protein
MTDDKNNGTDDREHNRSKSHPANAEQPTIDELRNIIRIKRGAHPDEYPFDEPERTPDVTGTNLGSWDETVVDGIVYRRGRLVATTHVPPDENDSGNVVARSENIPAVDMKQSTDWLAESRDDDE